MRTLQLVSIALALSTSLAACGGDDAPVVAPAESHVAGSDDAAHDPEAGMLRAQTAEPALTATTPVAVSPRDVATQTQTQTTQQGELAVRRAILATGIEDHEPVGASDTFAPSGEKLYLFLEVRNTSDDDAALTVSFVRSDLAGAREVGGMTLTVPHASRRYRTWAWTRQVHTAGAWTAIVRDAHGDEVSRLPFTVR